METFLDSKPAVTTQGRISASLWTTQLQILLSYSSGQKKPPNPTNKTKFPLVHRRSKRC